MSNSETDTVPYEGSSTDPDMGKNVEIISKTTEEVATTSDNNNKIDFVDFSTVLTNPALANMNGEDTLKFIGSMFQECQKLLQSTSNCSRTNEAIPLLSPRSNDNKGNMTPGTNVNLTMESNKVDRSKDRKSNKNNNDTVIGKTKSKRQKMDDQVSIHADSDIDNKINNLMQTDDSSSDDAIEELDISKFQSDLLDEAEAGPALNKELADLFSKLKESGLSKEKVASKAKEYPRPENVNLETKQVNPEIWSNIISTKDRSTDLQLQKGQKLISKASYAVAKIAESAIEANKNKHKRKDNVKKIFQMATDALAFISTAHLQNEKLRRELILKKLAYEQRSIGKDIPANDKYLFGDSLNKKLTEAAGISKLKPRKYNSNMATSSSTKSYRNSQASKNFYRPQKASRGRRGGFNKNYSEKRKDQQ